MKNTKVKIALAASALSLTLLLSACQSAAPGQTTPNAAPTAATLANYINIDDARNAALQAASVTDSDVNVERVWLSGEGDTALYSVQFASPEGALYQYDVNAVTGEATAVEPVDYERQKQEAALEREAEATAPGASAQPAASATDIPAASQPVVSQGEITLERAKEIALAHAGVKAADATFVETKQDYENGRLVYELEFIVVSGGSAKEYDYEVAASDGTIVSYDYDIEAAFTIPGGSVQTGGNQTTGSITLERAKEIALNHAGVKAADATFVETKQDYENGRLVYELEFIVVSGGFAKEYDYEVAAADGSIVSYDYDIEASYTVPTGNTQTGGTLSEADAKALALAQVAGATADNIYKWKKDYDDGRWVYEGKIVYNTWEYEFEMDAATGAFLEWDMESVFD